MRKLLLSLVFLALTFSSIGCNQASANSIVKIKDDGIEEPVLFTKEGNIRESSGIPNSTQDVVSKKSDTGTVCDTWGRFSVA